MTHQSGHVIISFATPINSAKPKGVKVWHCALACVLGGFLLGLIF